MLDEARINIAGGLDFALPRMARARQTFERRKLDDVDAAVTAEFARPGIAAKIRPGARIALGVGSRGVANIQAAARAAVKALRERGAHPFVFPAMGSHGGGTADGQRRILAGYGITENEVGAPVEASMDTVTVAEMEDGTPLHMDRLANEADGVVLMNRIKPHTSFRGAIESGICKMIIIGMGKINGASAFHGGYEMTDFGKVLPDAAQAVIDNSNFLFGVGLVEDAHDDTALVEAIPGETLVARETELQSLAKSLMARIYIEDIDVLVIDEIGKEISGAGADPNVIGSTGRAQEGFELPRVKKIVMLDLTDATKGNAAGVGSADVITSRLYRRIDFGVTYANIVTSTYLSGGAIPIPMRTEGEAVRLAVKTLIGVRPQDARIVRIGNTLELGEIGVSEALFDEARAHDRMELTGEPEEIELDVAKAA